MCAPESSERPTASASSCRVGLDHLLRRLVQAGVDDLEPGVAQRPRDHLGSSIVTIEARLRDDDSIPTLHVAETIPIAALYTGHTGPEPTGALQRFERRPAGLGPIALVRSADGFPEGRHPGARRRDRSAVLVFGLVVAALDPRSSPGGPRPPRSRARSPSGSPSRIREKAKDGGPFAYAGNSGDDGFWIAIEDGKLVALKIQKPGTKDCNVIWRGSKNTFVDCNGDPIRIDQLARYPIESRRRASTRASCWWT